jgi:hypothetical protein
MPAGNGKALVLRLCQGEGAVRQELAGAVVPPDLRDIDNQLCSMNYGG